MASLHSLKAALIIILTALVVSSSAYAKPVSKAEANQVMPEGEYLVKSGKRVRPTARAHAVTSHAGRKLVKGSIKKHPHPKSAHPSRQIASKTKHGKPLQKRPRKRVAKALTGSKPAHRQAHKAPKRRFPVARETPIERDMPFVSIPQRRVSHVDRTIVMEDPAVKAAPRKPPQVGRAPASVGAAETATREPDAFDLHSGADPIRGP